VNAIITPFAVMRENFDVARAHRAVLDKLTAQYGLHPAQHRMLVLLSLAETPPSQKELCEKFGITAATVAVTLAKLEEEGLICRTRSKEDNRVNRVQITEKGNELLSETRVDFDRADEQAFSDFTQDELHTLLRLLEKMKQNIMRKGQNK